MTTSKPRRRPGNVRVVDMHYSDYRRRVKKAAAWHRDSSGNVTDRPRIKRWQVQYIDLAGSQKSESFDAKGAAQARADVLTAQLAEGSHIDRRRSQTTVAVAAGAWTATLVGKSESTRKNYASVLANHVLPAWGNRELGSITHGDVSRWVAELVGRKGADGEPALSPATVHKCWIVFSGVLDYAVDDGLIRANPAAKVSLPKITSTKDVFLDHGQVERLASAADYLHSLRVDRTRVGRDRSAELVLDHGDDGLPIIPAAPASPDGLLIRFAAYSGLRVGELSGLQVRDIDLTKKLIHVRRANAEVAGKLEPGLPKGNKTRVLDLMPHLVDDLMPHLGSKAGTELVFTGSTGAPIRRGNFNKRVITPAAELAELQNVSAHTLRHTFASLCASAGVRIEIVSRWMGHASVAITGRVYVGLFDADLSASAGLVSAAMAAGK